MTGPAEPVFDGVLTPLLTPSHNEVLPQDDQIALVEDIEYSANINSSRMNRDSYLGKDKKN